MRCRLRILMVPGCFYRYGRMWRIEASRGVRWCSRKHSNSSECWMLARSRCEQHFSAGRVHRGGDRAGSLARRRGALSGAATRQAAGSRTGEAERGRRCFATTATRYASARAIAAASCASSCAATTRAVATAAARCAAARWIATASCVSASPAAARTALAAECLRS